MRREEIDECKIRPSAALMLPVLERFSHFFGPTPIALSFRDALATAPAVYTLAQDRAQEDLLGRFLTAIPMGKAVMQSSFTGRVEKVRGERAGHITTPLKRRGDGR